MVCIEYKTQYYRSLSLKKPKKKNLFISTCYKEYQNTSKNDIFINNALKMRSIISIVI